VKNANEWNAGLRILNEFYTPVTRGTFQGLALMMKIVREGCKQFKVGDSFG